MLHPLVSDLTSTFASINKIYVNADSPYSSFTGPLPVLDIRVNRLAESKKKHFTSASSSNWQKVVEEKLKENTVLRL